MKTKKVYRRSILPADIDCIFFAAKKSKDASIYCEAICLIYPDRRR